MIDHLPGRAKEEEQADVNVWDEPPDSPEKNIVKVLNKNQKLEIQAGTLNKLIEQLVPDADKPLGMRVVRVVRVVHVVLRWFLIESRRPGLHQDLRPHAPEFHHAPGFPQGSTLRPPSAHSLLTIRSWRTHMTQTHTTHTHNTQKLVQRYQVPVPKGMSREEYKSKVQQPMAKRVCNVIKYWVEKGWGDFLDSRLLYQLNGFIDGCLARDGYHQLAHSLRAAINKNKLSHHMDEKMFVSEPPEPKARAGMCCVPCVCRACAVRVVRVSCWLLLTAVCRCRSRSSRRSSRRSRSTMRRSRGSSPSCTLSSTRPSSPANSSTSPGSILTSASRFTRRTRRTRRTHAHSRLNLCCVRACVWS